MGGMILILFLVILSLLVFVHEFGHFFVAKKSGIRVDEFGFGLPPRIWGKKIRETIYSINALPIGGFVRLYGENGVEKSEQETGSSEQPQKKGKAFYEASLWQRLLVLTAGVFMNLVLAVVCFSFVYFSVGIPTKTRIVKIVDVIQNSPALEVGLAVDDQIVAIDGKSIVKSEDFIILTKEKAGIELELEVKREKNNPCKIEMEPNSGSDVLGGAATVGIKEKCRGENMLLYLIPRENPPEGEGPLGIIISDTEMKKYPFYQMPFYGIREGFKESWEWGKQIVGSMIAMVVNFITLGKVPKDLAGPVGMFQITGQAAKQGGLAVLQFLGILSVNLAIINLLPFPALDGGRVVFLLYEGVTKKKVSPKVEATVNSIGMIILLSFMVIITINDVIRLVKK